MKTFKFDEPITVLGVTFSDVREMICCAFERKAKDGIYVGYDSMLMTMLQRLVLTGTLFLQQVCMN